MVVPTFIAFTQSEPLQLVMATLHICRGIIGLMSGLPPSGDGTDVLQHHHTADAAAAPDEGVGTDARATAVHPAGKHVRRTRGTYIVNTHYTWKAYGCGGHRNVTFINWHLSVY